MTNSTSPTPPSATADATFDPPRLGDPRHSYAVATHAIGQLIEGVRADQLADPTPCPGISVEQMLEHLLMVMRRVAILGQGRHWSETPEEPVGADWHDHWTASAHDAMHAWGDPASLEREYDAPWGVGMPGAPLLFCFVGEIVCHGWDLATATGQPFSIDDEVLAPAMGVLRFGLPAEGRNTDELPFSDVVDPGPDAPVLLQLAGWFGRKVA